MVVIIICFLIFIPTTAFLTYVCFVKKSLIVEVYDVAPDVVDQDYLHHYFEAISTGTLCRHQLVQREIE